MKRFYIILALLAVLIVPAQASASFFYTLEGTVGALNDNGGLARSAGISIGDTVRYVIEVDTSRQGFRTLGNGKTKTVSNTYFTSLFSGNLNGYASTKKSYLKDGKNNFHAFSGNDNSEIYMNGWGGSFDNLAVGDSVQQIYESAYNTGDNWSYSQVSAVDLRVTNISNVAPTPIPGAALLMLGGLGVVGFVRRKLS